MVNHVLELRNIYTYQNDRESWTTLGNRKVNIMSYQLSGRYEHRFGSALLDVKPNHVFNIGAQEAYSVKRIEKGTSVCFTFVSETPIQTELIDCTDDPRLALLFKKLLTYRNVSLKTNYCMALSVIYEIMSLLEEKRAPQYVPSSKKSSFSEVRDYLMNHFYDSRLDLASFHQKMGISDRYFREEFRKLYGSTPTQYLISLRMNEAAKLLSEGVLNVSEIAETVGIPDVYYFGRLFKKKFSVSPGRFSSDTAVK